MWSDGDRTKGVVKKKGLVDESAGEGGGWKGEKGE